MFYKLTTRANRGFTLLEMALVLFILVVLAGIAVPATAGLVAQERLKAEAKSLQEYAVTARRLAVTEGRSYQITLKTSGFALGPYTNGGELAKGDVLASAKLSSNVAFTVQRWGAKTFSKPDGEAWVFRPDGICEPIRVHFQNGDGWLEFSFNPLTAGPRDDESHFR